MQEDADTLQSKESYVGSVKDLRTPEHSNSKIANDTESCMRVTDEDCKGKKSQTRTATNGGPCRLQTYDLLSNSWERGPAMVNSGCLFASASCGEFAYVAGGFGPGANGQLSLLNSAERYSSLTGEREPLPPMATPWHKCSGFFMDGKFYVIGGRDVSHQPIMSGEEYNPSTGVWRTIPNMYFTPEVVCRDMFEPSPPLVAVVNNKLYAVESTTNILKMYNKHNNTWRNLGRLPVPVDLHNGWGVAFKALGNKLFVMGDVDGITSFCRQPGPNAAEQVWQRLWRWDRVTSFLYNCAVMAI